MAATSSLAPIRQRPSVSARWVPDRPSNSGPASSLTLGVHKLARRLQLAPGLHAHPSLRERAPSSAAPEVRRLPDYAMEGAREMRLIVHAAG